MKPSLIRPTSQGARTFTLFNILVAFSLILSGCGAATPTAPISTAPVVAETAVPTVDETMTASPTLAAEPIGPTPQPTPDTRRKPEDWQSWPVVPDTVPAHLREIYRKGQELGNQAAHFSKVGDCQSIKEALLGMYEQDKPHYLPDDTKYLKETIDAFAGSFGRDGQAVQGGFNAASVLSPLWSNPDVCKPGETPLDCELRVYRPSYMIISLEIAWPGRTTDTYEKYMRRIIERAEEKGVIPILVTKADNVEGDHSINLATARLAYEYDLPLVNWWADAQTMPNHGMDPARNDGFHISMEAWTQRSLHILQTLDLVWKTVTAPEEASAPAVTETTEPQPDPTAALQVLAVPGAQSPAPASANGHMVYFGLARLDGEEQIDLGVFRLDPQNGFKTQLFGEGYNLQALSPDGSQMLVNKGSELYLSNSDGSNPALITSGFFEGDRQSAAWLPGGQALAFLARQTGRNLLVYYPLDGSGWRMLTAAADDPRELYPNPVKGSYIFLDGSGLVKRVGDAGLPAEDLGQMLRPAYSPDGKYSASTFNRENEKTGLVLSALNGSRQVSMDNIGDHIIDYAWSPDGLSLAVLTVMQSDYSGKWYDLRSMVITPADMGTRVLPPIKGLNARAAWAPDGSGILYTSTVEADGQYQVRFNSYDFASSAITDLSEAADLKDSGFIYLTNIFRP